MRTYIYIHLCILIKSELPGIICQLPEIQHVHTHSYMYTHTSTHTQVHTHTPSTHTHTTYTHTYVARSLTHIHPHARTHTTPRHAALLARYAVAPAVSVVVLF